MDGTSAYQTAWNIFYSLLDWMRTHTILNIFNTDITFLNLLISCVIVKIVLSLIHAVLPGIGDSSDDDDDGFTMPWGWNRP